MFTLNIILDISRTIFVYYNLGLIYVILAISSNEQI